MSTLLDILGYNIYRVSSKRHLIIFESSRGGMFIINLTPHPLNMMRDGETITITPTAPPARVATTKVVVGDLDGFPVNSTTFGDVVDMPEPAEGTVFVVSMLVATALKAAGRTDDVVIVDDAVRDSDGKIIGARAFGKV